jgi:hypothetical protein
VQRGARGIAEPHSLEDEFGSVELATIGTYGDVVHTFVSRSEYEGAYLPGYVAQESAATGGDVGLTAIDHVVGNVELGRMEHWVGFYERVFGMTEMLHFSDEDISTEYSALMSKVMTDGQGKIKFPINEPAEGKRKSQIEEYLEFNHGPGSQHVAMTTTNIVETVEALQRRGVVFLLTPDTYYEETPERVGDPQGDVLDAVAVEGGELADAGVPPQAAREHEPDLVLLEDVARAVADTRLGPGIRRLPEAERVLVVVRGLLRVAHVELDVVPAVERHEVRRHGADLTPPAEPEARRACGARRGGSRPR